MKKTLLIVDDEKHTRDGLRAAFEDQYEVTVAPDGAGALSVLDADPADVVITGRCVDSALTSARVASATERVAPASARVT